MEQIQQISLDEIYTCEGNRRCRICGCTDDDCRQCIEKTGASCFWVEPDLCSACAVELSR